MAKKPATQKTTQAPAKAIKKPAPKAVTHRTGHSGLGRGLGGLLDGSQALTQPIAPAKAPAVAPVKAAPKAKTPATPAPATLPVAPVVPPQQAIAESTLNAVLKIKISQIIQSPWQPRQTFDEAKINELADSIRQNGVIQPLICRRKTNGVFELVAGERRLRAATLTGEKTVPVILVEAEDRRAAEMAIIENIQREDLNMIEEAEGYRTLADTFKLTQHEVAERVGKARASVANALRLLDLPDETKQLVADGRLSPGHAKVLLSLKDAKDQLQLGRRCVTESLTVRALERIVKALLEPRVAPPPPRPDMPESHVRDLVDRMHRHFGTAIRLSSGVTHANGRHTKGVLEIDFYGNEDLDRILAILGVKINE